MHTPREGRSEATLNNLPQETVVEERLDYRAPQIVALGTATELMQGDITGRLIDGTGGWWVWGS